jgi:small-conductance mechanosensitive channel
MSDLTNQILIIVGTLLVALAVGLFLRYLLVHRLKKTVLDNWLIQIFGFLIIIPPVIAGIIVASLFIGVPATQMLLYLELVLPDIFKGNSLGSFIWNLALSLLIILLALGVARTLVKLINGRLTGNHLNVNVRTVLRRASYVGTLVIAFFLILSIWNIQFAIPAAALSVITVGFAFVIQDLLKNLVAGIYLLLEGPFHIGDRITTQQYTGTVEDVQLRATKLRIGNGEQAIVPNAILFSDIVINKTFYKDNRATIVITMPPEKYDNEQTTECILNTVKGVTGVVIKPEPTLGFSSVAGAFGSSTGTLSGYSGEILTLILRFWIPEGQDAVISEAMLALRAALPFADLSIREPAGL